MQRIVVQHFLVPLLVIQHITHHHSTHLYKIQGVNGTTAANPLTQQEACAQTL